MKLLIFMLLLISDNANGQRSEESLGEAIRKGDSIEILYSNEDMFGILTDTLPTFALDELNAWRDMKLVKYFYDKTNTLRKISYRNGGEGDYYFYFEGTYIRKVRVIKYAGFINLQHYFTKEDNQYSPPEIEKWTTVHPERKESFELLKTGRDFLNKFKSLL